MNVFDFLSQDELDAAPEDAAFAFTYLTRIAQRRLAEATGELDDNNEFDRNTIIDLNYDFVNIVVGLAKAYKIEPFTSMVIPRHDKFGYDDRRQFKADLDHYMTQLVVGNTMRSRRDSAAMAQTVKERIRSHLHHIKECIDKADLTDAKRASLHAKLREFEASLDKERVNLAALSGVLLQIMSLGVGVAALSDSPSFQKLISNVHQSIAEAKAAEDESRQLAPFDASASLSPPRQEVDSQTENSGGFRPARRDRQTGPRESFTADLDDEIPF